MMQAIHCQGLLVTAAAGPQTTHTHNASGSLYIAEFKFRLAKYKTDTTLYYVTLSPAKKSLLFPLQTCDLKAAMINYQISAPVVSLSLTILNWSTVACLLQ